MNKKLVEIMKQRGISADDLARLCGRHVATIDGIISGRNDNPTRTTREAIARVLGVDHDVLFASGVALEEVKLPPDESNDADQLRQVVSRLDFISAGLSRMTDAIDRNTAMLKRAWNVKEDDE